MFKRLFLISALAFAAKGQAPAPVSVTPNSGSGPSQTFQITYTDPRGYGAISSSMIILNSTVTFPSSCAIFFRPSDRMLYLMNDAGTIWQGPSQLGQPATLQNSQCSVDVSKSWYSGLGTQLTLQIAVAFNPGAYSGLKAIWVEVYDNPGDSGWVQLGTWTVSRGQVRDMFQTGGMTYTLSAAIKPGTQEVVIVDGVIWTPGLDYTINGRTLTFDPWWADLTQVNPLIQVIYWPAE